MLNKLMNRFTGMLTVTLFLVAPLQATENTMNAFTVSNQSITQSPNDTRDYQLITLSNQLDVLLISDPDIENSAVSLSVPVGSMHNPDNQLGLAHYLEHMLFLGSERYPTINEYSKFMTQNGGYTNAYTAQESTVYGFEVNDSAFDEALDRLGDVMRAPLLDEKYADKERHTVNAEHKTYYDNDMRKLYALQRYTLNPEYPMARFSTGDLTTLVDKPGSKLQDELVDFFAKHYSANTMKVAITSPRSIEALQLVASKYLTQIPNKKVKKPIVLTPMLTDKELAIQVEMKPTADIKMLQVNFLVPSVKAEYMYQPGAFISRLLGSDHKGGLSDTLIKAGLVDSVMAGFYAPHSDLYSRFSLQFKLTNKGLESQSQIMSTLFAFIELIKEQGINETQFQEQKSNLDRRFEFLSKQSGFNYVMGLSANMQLYPIKDILYFPYRLDAFNAQFIEQLLSYLTPENTRIFLLSPNAKGGTAIPHYQGEYSVNKTDLKQQQQWLDNAKSIPLVLPASNSWLPEKLALVERQQAGEAKQLINQLGHSVWFAQSAEIEEPKASLRLQLNSDIADQSAQNRVTMALLLSILKKQFSELNFVTQEAGLNFSFTQSNGLLISTSGYSDKQDKLLLTVLEHIKNTSFSEQSLRLAKQDLQRRLNNKEKMKAMDLAFDGFRQVIRQPAWSDETLLAQIDDLTVEAISQFRDEIFQQSTVRLLALGNFTEQQVLALDKELVKQISVQKKPFYSIKRLQAEPKQGALNYIRRSVMQDDALVMVHLSKFKGDKARATAELLNKLIQPAFYDQIRTQEQLSYSPFTTSFDVNDYVAFGLFTQSSAASNNQLHQRFIAFLSDFKSKLSKITEAELAQIKAAHIANYTAKPSSLGAEFSYLKNEWLTGKDQINNKEAYIAALNSVSLQEIQAFYDELFLSEENRQLIIVQTQGKKFMANAPLRLPKQVLINNVDQLSK
ncbi:peptidase M16 [Psychromonas sp. psych-6C06]|uniref:insulinase family protein n=1 Tax=Psychromonas sp. psych-6C06 TaxID=2058089 RepID=UPI000C34D899|nr:insulinase family protein [Psychromonas sp. psych-6C06]PKF60889.1 peptidase M16 [Psychromonas sp. psych-6C06]